MPDVFWITNLWNPYRHALWEACVRAGLNLCVVPLARSETGRHWAPGDDTSYRLWYPRTIAVRYHEGALYTLWPQELRFRPRTATVVFGGWEGPAYFQALRWARSIGAGRVGFYESGLQSRGHSGGPIAHVRRRFFAQMDAVLSVGPSSTAALRVDGVRAERIVDAPNSVDVATIHRDVKAHRAYVQNETGHRFLVLGQLIERKQPEVALRAFALIARPEDRLHIVGDGPLHASLLVLADRLNVTGQVDFLGHLSGGRLLQEFSWGMTLVMPSETEVWGLVVNEALAAGLHAVVSDRAGVASAVDGMPGVTITPPTLDAVAAAMDASRASWNGWILEPAALAFSPDNQARGVVRAIELAAASRKAALR